MSKCNASQQRWTQSQPSYTLFEAGERFVTALGSHAAAGIVDILLHVSTAFEADHWNDCSLFKESKSEEQHYSYYFKSITSPPSLFWKYVCVFTNQESGTEVVVPGRMWSKG